MNELFLHSFFSFSIENTLNKRFYNGDCNCEEDTLGYVNKVLSIPLVDFLEYLILQPMNAFVTPEHITQCSHIELCHIEMCEAFKRANCKGLTLSEIGQKLHNDGITRTNGTESKFGENVKGAKQFGLTFYRDGKWYLSAIGAIFDKLNEKSQTALLARNLCREPLYSQILIEAINKDVFLEDYMCTLSESTIKRRTPCVKAFCNLVVKQSLIEGAPIFHTINK